MPRLDTTSASPAVPRWITGSLRIDRIRVPAAILIALLQRSPALRAVADVANFVLESPAGAVLKAAAASVAALGAVDSVAGATVYALSTGSPGHPSPYTITAGAAIAGVGFSLMSTPLTDSPPQSWTIGGSIPPGLKFGTKPIPRRRQNGKGLASCQHFEPQPPRDDPLQRRIDILR